MKLSGQPAKMVEKYKEEAKWLAQELHRVFYDLQK